MGTRADFYIKENQSLKWLGSIAWDGYGVCNADDINQYSPNDINSRTCDYLEYLIHHSKNGAEYAQNVSEYIAKRNDGTNPNQGWPWPWNNSKLTDECYVFDTESNRLLRMGRYDGDYKDHTTPCKFSGCQQDWYDEDDNEITPVNTISFCVPDMSTLKNVARGGRSGIITISYKKVQ